MKIKKEDALRILQRLISTTEELMKVSYGSPLFEKWTRSVRLAINNIFGELSKQIEEFNQIQFAPIETYGIRIEYYEDGIASAKALLESMLEEIQDYWPHAEDEPTDIHAPAVAAPVESLPEPCVFIGHGRSRLWARLKIFLEDELEIKTVSYESESRVGKSIIAILEDMLGKASFAVLVLTAEDETSEGLKRARQNVVHEAGLFQGRLGFTKAVVLRQSGLEDFSNVEGLQYIGFTGDNIEEAFYELQRVLKRERMLR